MGWLLGFLFILLDCWFECEKKMSEQVIINTSSAVKLFRVISETLQRKA